MTPLNILYQDRYLVAVDKPAGMLVHAGREPLNKKWIAMKVIRDQLGQRVHTFHRLDRPTSGVLMFALDKVTHNEMRSLFEHGKVQKTYYAIVVGKTPASWTCDQGLSTSEGEETKEAVTRCKRIRYDTNADVSVLEVRPETGRYHQIRKHLSIGGFPIVGDFLYGDIDTNLRLAEELGIDRMCLVAQAVEFQHPMNGSPILIEADLPSGF